ncbi:MAG: hypothetical protein EB101_07780, partial [Chitinophagia bacterium]|nr:hypothetical protein [Chitinophagia bacterium]
MNNLHITANEMRYASRVLKQTDSILNFNIASKVYIASLHAEDLKEQIIYRDNLILVVRTMYHSDQGRKNKTLRDLFPLSKKALCRCQELYHRQQLLCPFF